MTSVDRDRMRENEERFAHANGKIHDSAVRLKVDPVPFFCECSTLDCTELIYVTLEAYEAVRESNRFMLLPGHDDPDVEQVIDERGSYLVVEKFR
jgi:hypothetical protein